MEQRELELVEGTVSVVIYQNEDNGYTILKLDVRDEEVTVVGTMPGVAPGEYLSVRGRWTRHPTYGVQLKAQVVERRLPQGIEGDLPLPVLRGCEGYRKGHRPAGHRGVRGGGPDSHRGRPDPAYENKRHLTQAGPPDRRGLPPADGHPPAGGVFDRASAPSGAGSPPSQGLRRRGAGGGAGQPLSAGQ